MAHLQKPIEPRRPAKPLTIYRRGKPITNDDHLLSESSDDDHQLDHHHPQSSQLEQPSLQSHPTPTTIITLESTTSLDHLQTRPLSPPSSSSSSSLSDQQSTLKPTSGSKLTHKKTSTKDGHIDSTSESSSSGSDDDSQSSGDSSSEDEKKLVPIYKPVFITKRNRGNGSSTNQIDSEEALEQKRLEEDERRKKASQKLVEATLVRELADKEVEQVFPDVDDTDGLDPEAEFEAWRLRELKRLTRDREALIQRAKEKEELEARRMIPEEDRLKEDLQYAEQTRKAKPKGHQAFLQKYHHKGAFYADSEILKKHDYSAPTEGTFTKMELLPAVMQVRDFGKMSRSKWTHLAKEDTTSFDAGWSQKKTQGGKPDEGCFNCGQRGHLKRDCTNQHRSEGAAGQGLSTVELGSGSRRRDEGTVHYKRRAGENGREEYPSKRREDGRARDGPESESRREHRNCDSDRSQHDSDRYRKREERGRGRDDDDGWDRDQSRYQGRERSRERDRDRGHGRHNRRDRH